MIIKRFFSYDGSKDGREFKHHETAEQAAAACTAILDDLRENAGDGWPENSGEVYWGEIRQRSQMCDIKDRCTIKDCTQENCDNAHISAEFDFKCDYRMEDVGDKP